MGKPGIPRRRIEVAARAVARTRRWTARVHRLGAGRCGRLRMEQPERRELEHRRELDPDRGSERRGPCDDHAARHVHGHARQRCRHALRHARGAAGTQTLALLAQLSLWSTSQCSITVNPTACSRSREQQASSGQPHRAAHHAHQPRRGRSPSRRPDHFGGREPLVNSGLVKKSGGAGTATISVDSVTNTGTSKPRPGRCRS